MLFGHALMEKLVEPYKSITAHVWTVQVTSDWVAFSQAQRMADIDTLVAASLRNGFSSTAFCHLPVLGGPQQDAAFYEDAEVFRPKRERRTTAEK